MPSKPGRRKKCGAASRRKGGAPCDNWAVDGAERCRMHGGTHPKGGDAPQATQRLKHGMYAKAFTAEELERFEAMFPEMLADPSAAMMADAVLMRVKAQTALGRADAQGMVTTRQSATKHTEPLISTQTGAPVTYVDDAGARRPVVRTSENVHAERQDVMGPVAELLMRAHRLAEASLLIKKKAGIVSNEDASALDDRDIADIMREEFADAGAYGEKGDDGSTESGGAAGDAEAPDGS